jgi:hypothetical protein
MHAAIGLQRRFPHILQVNLPVEARLAVLAMLDGMLGHACQIQPLRPWHVTTTLP